MDLLQKNKTCYYWFVVKGEKMRSEVLYTSHHDEDFLQIH